MLRILGISYISYIFALKYKNIRLMNTSALSPSKRKIINLDETNFKTLSIMAIEESTNLKNYFERM